MKRYLSGGLCAGLAGVAMVFSLGAGPAQAQVPGGSYLQTCTNIRAHGDRVMAMCRRADGSWQRTAINDVFNCNGGLANMNGQLTCARRTPEYGFNRRHHGWEGYGSSYGPRFYDYYGR